MNQTDEFVFASFLLLTNAWGISWALRANWLLTVAAVCASGAKH